MIGILLREVTQDNWRATLQLAVLPDQQHFIAESVPIAAIALAKAFIRPFLGVLACISNPQGYAAIK